MKAVEHFITITKHKLLVMDGCFKLGMYYQGIMHDLSKYSPTEFLVGAKYYQGDRSPNNAEREDYGMSRAWMHHQGRNKHHFEYWIDYTVDGEKGKRKPMRMPKKYVVEMFVDRIAASKNYNPKTYTDRFPLEYFMKGYDTVPMHEKTKEELKFLLEMLAEHGEDYTYDYIRREVLKNVGRRKNIIQWYAGYGKSYFGKLLRSFEKLGNFIR